MVYPKTSDMPRFNAQNIVEAKYSQQKIPMFRGNPLIEALPPSMEHLDLIDALTLSPEFDPIQRDWSISDRFMMIESLGNFMIPMSMHVSLCLALNAMLRSGYVGRAPRTPEHAKIFQTIYENQIAGRTFTQSASSRTSQISTSLIGLSGMGKTTAVARWCAHLPEVIYHEQFNLYQIPCLHVEMPSDGSSVKGLAHGILQKIDKLVPGAAYWSKYTQNNRTGADVLMTAVAYVMNLHLVGLLICDETQNLANSSKGCQTVMTELVSACNELKVPILLIGTNKAQKVLSLDLRQARRSCGHGVAPWDRLTRGAVGSPSEWDDFISVLWRFQWVKNPVDLTHHLNHIVYECCQGVIGLAISLFASAQMRAMLDGTEVLTPELLLDVFDKEFKLVHLMVEALRSNNLELIAKYDDIAPLDLKEVMKIARDKLALLSSPLFSVRSDAETFAPRLVTGLTSFGYPAEAAAQIADDMANLDKTINLAEGVKTAVDAMSKLKPVGKRRKDKLETPLPADRFDIRKNDYRRARSHALAEAKSVLEKLKEFQMAPALEDILAL